MNWKSTAVVTGATALIGWLASPNTRTPDTNFAAQPARAAQQASISDIEQQAARLQARLRAETTFREPSRDPFRFEERRAPAVRPPSIVQTPPAYTAPVSQGPKLTLSGLATDVVDGVPQRTAILSGPDGVLLVREGDIVGELYRVTTIEDEAVNLLRVSDGEMSTIRLAGQKP